VIEVNEQGTEAAAVTTSGLATKSAPMFLPFILNRPFVYAIYDKYTRSLLFLGTVNQFPNQ
jgi:serpin B